MTRLEDWVDLHAVGISRGYVLMAWACAVVGMFRPVFTMPAVCFGMAAIVIRRDELVRAVRSMTNT